MLWSRSINSSLVALIKMALERYPGGMTTRLRTKQDDKGSIQKQTNTAHLRSRWKRMLDRLTLTLLTVAAAVASNDRKRFLLEMRWNLPWYLQKEVLRLSDQSAIPYRTNEFRRVFNKMDVDFLKLNSDFHGFSYGALLSPFMGEQVAFHSTWFLEASQIPAPRYPETAWLILHRRRLRNFENYQLDARYYVIDLLGNWTGSLFWRRASYRYGWSGCRDWNPGPLARQAKNINHLRMPSLKTQDL